MKNLNEKGGLVLVCIIAFLARLVALPFAQVVDADATTRIFGAVKLLNDFKLISEGIWLPLHHYLNAFVIFLTGEHTLGPVVIHMLLASLTAIPIYYFTKREFNTPGAWFAALFYVLTPVVFRNSFHVLAGLPHAFFVAHSLNYLSLTLKKKKVKPALFAGFFLTLAAGFRYEAWVLIAIFTGILAFSRQWKSTLVFWCVAMIIPAYWMIGNYIVNDHFLYGVTGVYNSAIVESQNDGLTKVDYIKRILFFPFSWFFLFSPFLAVPLLNVMGKKLKRGEVDRRQLVWGIPFIIMLIIFIYKSIGGTLLMQHRFTLLLILLSAPFTAVILQNIERSKLNRLFAGIVLITLLPLSYVWMYFPYEYPIKFLETLNKSVREMRVSSLSEINAIPRLDDQNITVTRDSILQNLNDPDGLILDFIGWENTYYLALESQLNPKHIFIIDGGQEPDSYAEEFRAFIRKYPEGVIELNCLSMLIRDSQIEGDLFWLDSQDTICLKLSLVQQNVAVSIFNYKMVSCSGSSAQAVNGSVLQCPEKYSKIWCREKIKNNRTWYNNVKWKARVKNISVEEALETDVQWMMDQEDSN